MELLLSKIEVQKAIAHHSVGWQYNFQSKSQDTSLVLQHEGLVRDVLHGVAKGRCTMAECELKILKLTLVVLASYYTRKL